MKRYIKHILLGIVSVVALLTMLVPFAPAVSAAGTTDCASQGLVPLNDPKKQVAGSDKLCCPSGYEKSTTNCIVGKYVNPTIKVLSWVVGIAVVGGIIYGGILYASSEGDSGKVTKAKTTITKSLTALVVFLVFGAFLQFLSPISLTKSTSVGCNTSFMGMKTWYAYVPKSEIDGSTCTVNDVTILPSGNNKGVLPYVALAIVDDLLRITAVVAVAFVITGGVRYATSQGEPGEVKKALSTIINALIGLATAMVAAAVVSYIGNKLSGQ
jgi:uncharacterized membrane protein (DUF373 family)